MKAIIVSAARKRYRRHLAQRQLKRSGLYQRKYFGGGCRLATLIRAAAPRLSSSQRFSWLKESLARKRWQHRAAAAAAGSWRRAAALTAGGRRL